MIIDRLLIPSFEISEKTPDDFELESSTKWKGPLISWVSEYQYDNFEFDGIYKTIHSLISDLVISNAKTNIIQKH